MRIKPQVDELRQNENSKSVRLETRPHARSLPQKKKKLLPGVTKFLSKTSLYRLWDWFDDQTWYPLGRVVGGTVYPVRER